MSGPGKEFGILVVDDNPRNLKSITDILKADPSFDVVEARSAAEGLSLSLQMAPDLVVLGFRALDDCIDLLFKIKECRTTPPLPTFLIIYERSEFPDFARGHEQGADDYIERSLCIKVLLPKVRTLLQNRVLREELREEKQMLEEANELLERNFRELTAILLKILEVRLPGTNDRAETAKAAAEYMAARLDIRKEARKNLIFAALMHEMGKLGLPDEIAAKHYGQIPPGSLRVYQQYATVGSMIISTITGFKDAAEAVYHQLENYDGTGFPDALMGDEIPLGARILRAIVYAEEACAQGESTDEAVDKIRQAVHSILDPRVANPIMEFLLERRRKDGNKHKVPIEALEVGMVVADDVYAASGVKLLPKGVKLQEKMVALLVERNKTDPIIGGVYVATAG